MNWISNQKNSEKNIDHKVRYKKDLLTRIDYSDQMQLWLKDRVLKTYSRLLKTFTGISFEKGRFLDTGSADGAFAKICKRYNIICESLDIDMGVDFEKDKFPCENNSFKYVNSNSVIEHLQNPENYLKEIHRVLEEGGYLFIVTPHWPYAYKEFFDSFTHYHPYSYKSLDSLLRAYMFEPIALVPWLVNKSSFFWKLPAPYSFWVAKNLLLFQGKNKWAPSFLKGRSKSLLALARKKYIG